MIIAAAVKTKDGRVYSAPKPGRHHDAIHVVHQETGDKEAAWKLLSSHVQGFTTETGKFLTREEAFFEALKCDQLLPPYNPANPSERRGQVNKEPRELFSEDLW